jgi:hypothetical protein
MSDRSGSFLRVQTIVLAAFLILSAARPGPSVAQEVPPVSAAPSPSAPEEVPPEEVLQEEAPQEEVPQEEVPPEQVPLEQVPPEPPPSPPAPGPSPLEEPSRVGKFMDETHARFERKILARVIWFDNFFGTVKTEELRQPEYLLRWRNSFRVEERGQFKYRTSVRGSFVLPKISKRLRLVISGETESEPDAARLPEDPGTPGFDRTLPNTRLVNTELRYSVIQKPVTNLFLGAGVRVRIPFETFVRSRFQFTHRLGEVALARFGETLFWKNTDGFGETTEVDLERQLAPKTLLRWANAGTWSEATSGLDWGTDLSLLRELSPRSAITLSGGLFGNTRPTAAVQTYRILARYRRNFLRPWLFYELEPEVTWPRDPAGAYHSALAFTFRVEVVFQESTTRGSP